MVKGPENHGLAGAELQVNFSLLGGTLPCRRNSRRTGHWVENGKLHGWTRERNPSVEIGFSAIDDEIIPTTVEGAADKRQTSFFNQRFKPNRIKVVQRNSLNYSTSDFCL